MTAKRRRLNNASSTLSKPFVSPLKTLGSPKTPVKDGRDAVGSQNKPSYVPSVLAHTVTTAASTPPSGNVRSKTITPSRQNMTKRPAYSTPFSKRLDPAEQAVQKAITSLELQIKSVRNDIDTLNQAAKYTNDSTDGELEDLALKWKLAAHGAAEEIFGSVKERVNRMGGVEAWRESEKQKFDRANGIGEYAEPEVEDDADCEFDSQGEELPEEEQEYRKTEKRRMKREAMEAADVEVENTQEATGPPQVWQQSGSDDDVSAILLPGAVLTANNPQSFTMDMMLRSLNIDLDVIGYDKDGQRWIT